MQVLTDELANALREGASVEVCREFTETRPVPRHMIIFGAMEFSAALSTAALAMGFRVTVCDPRPLFATPARFPGAELVVQWPTEYLATTTVDEHTVICVLEPRLPASTPSSSPRPSRLPVAYVGAMGSRTTHDRRVASLRERGVDDAALAALHSPIGLDLGASTPEETAISILAEVLAARADSDGARRSRCSGGRSTRARRAPVESSAANARDSRPQRGICTNRHSRSRDIGSSYGRTPSASRIAFARAGATGLYGASLIDFAPSGPSASWVSAK